MTQPIEPIQGHVVYADPLRWELSVSEVTRTENPTDLLFDIFDIGRELESALMKVLRRPVSFSYSFGCLATRSLVEADGPVLKEVLATHFASRNGRPIVWGD